MVLAWSGRGRQPTREQVVAGAPRAQPVALLAAALPVRLWSRPTMQEGSKGPIVADFVDVLVVAVSAGLPGPEDWLILRQNVLTGELKTYLSNASADTPWPTLVRLSGMRWPIETCFEEGKQYLGIRAYFFLVRRQGRIKTAPGFTLPQVHCLVGGVIPKRTFAAQ
jgi:hypothetical protein